MTGFVLHWAASSEGGIAHLCPHWELFNTTTSMTDLLLAGKLSQKNNVWGWDGELQARF